MAENLNCDGSGPHALGEVRRMELSGGAGLIFCRLCWDNEIEWRRRRNNEMVALQASWRKFDIPKWEEGEIYAQ